MRSFIWGWTFAAASLAALPPTLAENLLVNGDFEDIQRDEADAPILDAYGFEQPTAWFRSVTDPATQPTPLTELISPNNMNNAAGTNAGDDSDGSGTNSVAINFVEDSLNPPFGIGSDWRSEGFDTIPGETLVFSIDVKFIGVSQEEFQPGSDLFEGILAQVRSFTEQAPDGSTGGDFKGEHNVQLQARNYTLDQWNRVTSSFVVPEEGEWTDIRVSANLFIPPSPLFAGQILFDNLSVTRLTADFDDDGDVDDADLGLWKTNFGDSVVDDADLDGDSDGADFLSWQREFGLGVVPPGTGAAIGAVPEPSALALTLLAFGGWRFVRGSGRQASH